MSEEFWEFEYLPTFEDRQESKSRNSQQPPFLSSRKPITNHSTHCNEHRQVAHISHSIQHIPPSYHKIGKQRTSFSSLPPPNPLTGLFTCALSKPYLGCAGTIRSLFNLKFYLLPFFHASKFHPLKLVTMEEEVFPPPCPDKPKPTVSDQPSDCALRHKIPHFESAGWALLVIIRARIVHSSLTERAVSVSMV